MEKAVKDAYEKVEKAMKDGVEKVDRWTTVRERDETGHRTGLGTIARSALSHPVDTYRSLNTFKDTYDEMIEKKTDHLVAHEKANYDVTKMTGDTKLAAGISAFREQSKNHRTPHSTSAAARKGYGDMRTPSEVAETMQANKAGRDRAMNEARGGGMNESGKTDEGCSIQ